MNEPNKTASENPQAAQHTGLGDALAAAGDAAIRLEWVAEQTIEKNLARHPRWRTALALAGWSLVVLYFLFATLFLGLRYWLLPNIGRYSDVIEKAASEAIGERVTIGSVRAGWDGLRPEINLADVRIHDSDGRLALSLPVIEAVVGWSSLFYGAVRFESLMLDRPDLEVRRDGNGHLHIAGMQLRSDPAGRGFSDWLLAQREVLIRDGRISWDDQQRKAPRLELAGVNLLVRNLGDLHRFALRAVTARELASALDIRGELRGASLAQLQDWGGRLYAELEYTDLAAWRRWFDYPLEVRSGQGGVRLWLDFAERRINDATADVALAGVAARIAPDLPLLELDYLRGRLGGKQERVEEARPLDIFPSEPKPKLYRSSTQVFGRGVALRTKGGVALAPADFSLRVEDAREGKGAAGEFTANALDLQPLAQIAEFLPFPAAFRKRLVDTDPRGQVFDLKYTWSGTPEQPEQLTLHSRFDGLGARANAGLPGFGNLSGVADATEKGGTLVLAAKKVTLELSDIVVERRPVLDTLSGQIGWRRSGDKLELSFNQIALANDDAAGTLSGSYETRPGSAGVIDLTAQFVRAEARSGWRYIPGLKPEVRQFLNAAILAGRASDVRVRLKGDLARFPFADAKEGTFQVTTKFSGVEFNYADGWPRVGAAAGDLLFEGLRMQVLTQRAGILGARALNVHATIPDLFHGNEVLTVEGQAEGPTSEFLGYVEGSPVTRIIDGAAQGLHASGNGRMQIRIELPVRNQAATRVVGNYVFQNNQVALDELPALTQVNGRLDFSETGIALRAITAQFLGGPVTLSGQARADGALALGAQGNASIAALRRYLEVPLVAQVSGTLPWRGNFIIRKRAVDVVVESNLQGVAIDLPQPLGKLAAEAVPLRLERAASNDSDVFKRFPSLRLPPRGDVLSVSLGGGAGRNLNALLIRRSDARGFTIERGNLALNEPVAVPDRAGLLVSGNLPLLDVERWQAATGDALGAASTSAAPAAPAPTAASASPASSSSAIAAINLKIGALDVAGKRFNDLALRVASRSGQWAGTVEAKEFAGEVQWRPEGRGRILARLKYLTLPEDRPVDTAPGAAAATAPQRELPALDIVAEDFVLRDRKLGRLELVAINAEAREWRIEKLQLSNPDATLLADGVWQTWAARPSVNVNLKLEVSDAGKYLDRMGYPKVMQSGSARMEGKIGWAGNPQAIDYATLTGNLSLSAEKGQFLKADPGIAKLLGLLSLQSLVTLDLRDLFREGFSYDTLGGTASVSKGVMTTQDFRMKGPSAQVSMNGIVDLARETQTLHMRVVPSVGDGASTLAAFFLANPILGIGATLLQRLLKDPLGQIFSVDYDVTGTWTDPKVTRTRVETPKAVESSTQ